MKSKIAIIGSGIGGLASAIRLASNGHDVFLYEKNNTAGGKLSEIRKNGYRFDTGPSLFTLPELLKELFTISGENSDEYITIKKLDTICRYFYNDGTFIDAHECLNDFAEEVEKKTGVGKAKLLKYLEKSKELYDLTAKTFIFSPFQKLRTFNTPEAKKIARNLFKLDAFTTVHKRNKEWFREKRIIQMFDRYATYNGSNPYKAPATLKIISHLEHNTGAYIPGNGIYQIIVALKKLAEKKGVKIVLNTKVDEIIIENKKVKGIKLSDKVIDFDIVVNDADIYYSYNNLLKNIKYPKRFRRQELSTSAIIFYWGIKKKFEEMKIHNILFSKNYKEEFQYLFNKKLLYPDPTVYIYISSKIIRGDAPENHENWFVMINAPSIITHDQKELIVKSKQTIFKKIRETLNIKIEEYIENEEWITPQMIEERTNSFKGALYGPSSNSRFSAFNRHANFKRNIKGLYFTGGSVHPGGGIPLCMASAKIVSDLISEDFI